MDQFASLWLTSGSLLVYEGMSGSLLCHFGSTSASILASEDDFGVTSESLFTYEVDFGITLGLLLAFEGGFGGALRPLEDHLWHMRSTLGALSGHFEVSLELLWDHSGYMGVAVGHFRITLRSFWRHFGYMRVRFQETLRFSYDFNDFVQLWDHVWGHVGIEIALSLIHI